MASRDYPNPPVHEVVLHLTFTSPADDDTLLAIQDSLAPHFQKTSRAQETEVLVGMGSEGQKFQHREQFNGWVFERRAPHRVLRTLRDRLAYHAAREGAWPRGSYVGWETIFEEFKHVLDTSRVAYKNPRIGRAGLRYLNRIAIPVGTELEDWFNLYLTAPDFLVNTVTLNLTQTWTEVLRQKDMQAKVNLARIEIEDPEIADDKIGLLFDISIFNQWMTENPSMKSVAAWFNRAHAVENRIFESSITDKLRETFMEGKDAKTRAR